MEIGVLSDKKGTRHWKRPPHHTHTSIVQGAPLQHLLYRILVDFFLQAAAAGAVVLVALHPRSVRCLRRDKKYLWEPFSTSPKIVTVLPLLLPSFFSTTNTYPEGTVRFAVRKVVICVPPMKEKEQQPATTHSSQTFFVVRPLHAVRFPSHPCARFCSRASWLHADTMHTFLVV